MRAIAIHAFGGIGQLQPMDLPTPEAGPEEILIRVKAAGVNPVDWKIREGLLQGRLPHRFPLVPGWDAAGVVEKTGTGVTLFAAGDEVYAYCRTAIVQHGSYAEFVAVPQRSAARKPRNLSFEEAASVPLAALTAYQSLFDAANLQAGEAALILAAAGGVGTFAVQLARDRGAAVLGTASASHHAYLRSLGCRWPIDYTAGDFRATVRKTHPRGVDVILDAAGGDSLAAGADVLSPAGRIVSLLDPEGVKRLEARGVRAFYVFVAPHHEELETLTRLIEQDRLRTHLSAVLPLAEAAQAHRLSQAGHVQGKVVLRI